MDINVFAYRLKDLLTYSTPYDTGEMRAFAFMQNQVIPMGTDKVYFEVGNEQAEQQAPHYHILEDAQVIYKRGLGTTKSKGSQAFVEDKGKRDYGNVSFTYDKYTRKMKSVYSEYRKNVRGKRSRVESSTRKVITSSGRTMVINKEAKYYQNIHYHYIEKNLESITQTLAQEFNARLMRTSIDFEDEFESWTIDNFII